VREMVRFLLATVLTTFAMLGTVPGAGAQIPPVDDATDAPLEETVEGTVEAVEATGGATTEAVEGTGGGGTSPVEQGAKGTAGSVIGSATESTGGTVGTSGGAPGEDAAGTSPATAGESRERGHAGSRSQRAPNETAAARASARAAAADHGSPPGAATYVPLLVRLTNDADSDGSYSDVEVAPVPDSDVPFQVQLENTGSNELAILAIRNASAEFGQRDNAICGDLPGKWLAPGQSTACRFTVEAFAPPKGERAVTVLAVDAVDADPITTGTVTDPTVIRTEHGSVLGLFVRRGLDFLATTGARIAILLAATVALAVSGALLITMGNRRRAVSRASAGSTTPDGAPTGPPPAFRGPHHPRSRPSPEPRRRAVRTTPEGSTDRGIRIHAGTSSGAGRSSPA